MSFHLEESRKKEKKAKLEVKTDAIQIDPQPQICRTKSKLTVNVCGAGAQRHPVQSRDSKTSGNAIRPRRRHLLHRRMPLNMCPKIHCVLWN